MQTTLEVRWFLKGSPPAAVQHWFRFECPGHLLTPEAQTREDLYAYGNLDDYLNKFKQFAPNLTSDRINLKLREGNLELKLREEQFEDRITHYYGDRIWAGRVERWRKLNLQQQESPSNEIGDLNWIPVCKKRSQKSDRSVESELTLVETKDSAWWTIAFEMSTDNNLGVDFFCEIVEQAALTYSGPKLLTEDSYSYAHWLDKFITSQN